VNETGGRVAIPEVPAPRAGFKSAEEAVELSLNWEKKVTDQINGLMDLAIRQKDHLSHNFLEWFVNEQLEEVSSMDHLLSLIRRAGEKGLLMVEDRLGKMAGAAGSE
jgi:ferritin